MYLELKIHHDVNTYNIDGFKCFRRDRVGRRGDGVAVYISTAVKSDIFVPSFDDPKFELMWIKTKVSDNDCYIGALYHRPKPNYTAAELLSFIERTLDLLTVSVNGKNDTLVLLCGDCNQLCHDSLLDTGLQAALYAPTHRGHNLDRIYTNIPVYDNIKVVQSTIVTEHRAIVAWADNNTITDHNKTKETVELRRVTPAQHASILSFLQSYSWQAICLLSEAQLAMDAFYTVVLNLLDRFYPVSKITRTSRNPPFVTPEIKQLLRKKNHLLHCGRVHEANAIAERVGKHINDFNSVSLKGLSSQGGAKEMWDKVRLVIGKNKAEVTRLRLVQNS